MTLLYTQPASDRKCAFAWMGIKQNKKKCAYVFDEEVIQKKNKLKREIINIFYVFVHNYSIFFRENCEFLDFLDIFRKDLILFNLIAIILLYKTFPKLYDCFL